VRALVIALYEIGRPSWGGAAAAATLADAGADVAHLDLSRQRLSDGPEHIELVALHVPMHTATRIALEVLPRVRERWPRSRVVVYGLYGPLNEERLLAAGAHHVVGPEHELALAAIARNQAPPPQPLPRARHARPDRRGMLPLAEYAHLHAPDGSAKLAAYVEATRGCKHTCRHCPIVPVYGGRFRATPADVVLADVDQQVAAGAAHVTFGDPDFLNGPTHAVRIVRALHERHPAVTWDATIKVEHLVKHQALLPELARLGCVLVTTAAESLDDRALAILDKRHTRADFERALAACRQAGIAVQPTWLPFAPWTRLDDVRALFEGVAQLGLADAVPAIQYAIRLLLPDGSPLLEHPDVAPSVDGWNADELVWRWAHPDPRVDALQRRLLAEAESLPADADRREAFERLWRAADEEAGQVWGDPPVGAPKRATVPYLDEPWYC
jgi:radical SAM superfamily enzyme YgiQ (UPF0313 family)